jgi:hypothetical protein
MTGPFEFASGTIGGTFDVTYCEFLTYDILIRFCPEAIGAQGLTPLHRRDLRFFPSFLQRLRADCHFTRRLPKIARWARMAIIGNLRVLKIVYSSDQVSWIR